MEQIVEGIKQNRIKVRVRQNLDFQEEVRSCRSGRGKLQSRCGQSRFRILKTF